MQRHDATYMRLIQSPRWRQLRQWYLTDHPECACCRSRGIIRAAQCVHHITPVETARTLQEAEDLCYSPANLQALCTLCHAEIHRAAKSHSRAIHRQRTEQAFARWKEQILSKTKQL